MMKIWANTIVNNEERFIWYSVMSVIDYVDKVVIWDTGSNDNTIAIIKEIQELRKDKILFKELGLTDKYQFSQLRQQMLEQSKCDWILILDGDEIWSEKSINTVIKTIKEKGKEIEGIVVPCFTLIGDIYHYQETSAGKYNLLGRKGHFNLRAINKSISGLHVDLPYGREGYFDSDNKPIQEREKIIFLDAPYLHATHLRRSDLNRHYNKFKYEIGQKFNDDFVFPEVLYQDVPKLVPSPWTKMSNLYYLRALIETPLKKIKRQVLK